MTFYWSNVGRKWVTFFKPGSPCLRQENIGPIRDRNGLLFYLKRTAHDHLMIIRNHHENVPDKLIALGKITCQQNLGEEYCYEKHPEYTAKCRYNDVSK